MTDDNQLPERCTDCGKDLSGDLMDKGQCWSCFSVDEATSEASYQMTATEQAISDDLADMLS